MYPTVPSFSQKPQYLHLWKFILKKKKIIIIIIIIILSSYMCRSKVWLVGNKMVSALFEQLYMDQWIRQGLWLISVKVDLIMPT